MSEYAGNFRFGFYDHRSASGPTGFGERIVEKPNDFNRIDFAATPTDSENSVLMAAARRGDVIMLDEEDDYSLYDDFMYLL